MGSNEMRKQFEAALLEHLRAEGYERPEMLLGRRSNGEYISPGARSGWWAWQASREAVVIDLPSVEENGTLTRGVAIGVLGVVRSNIEAQGLKVAP